MHHWADDVITATHPRSQATAMSIDLSGSLAVLGSRRNLSLIDLNKPKEILKKINLNCKWDISRVTWNPSSNNQQYFLTSYNQWVDLWHYNQSTASNIATFQGHTRSVSDVDWSALDPNLMATCSLDQYIYLWDIRETKKPKLVTSTVSGASRVRWSKFDEHTIASSHDGNLRIWDIRNGKAPTQYITAHVSKINYIDWSPTLRHELSSASHDMTISFWNTLETPRVADFQIHAQCPVWRAEYTPFGTAMASVAFRSYRETPFTLWNRNDVSQPVHVFSGHTDVVLDFQWRKDRENNWQLVTWSKDQILRLWPIDRELVKACGGEMSASQDTSTVTYYQDYRSEENSTLYVHTSQLTSSVSSAETPTADSTVQGSTPDFVHNLSHAERNLSSSPSAFYPPKSRGASTPSTPDTLEKEFRLLNFSLPNLNMNEMDRVRRSCTVTLKSVTQYFVLNITFPISYPQTEAPSFKFVEWSEGFSKKDQDNLLLTLQETAQHHVRNNRGCLEPCLRQLTTRFREMSYTSDDVDGETDHVTSGPFAFPYSQNVYRPNLRNIPFPRTCGARFCNVGYLVVFLRPTHVKGFHSTHEKIPRSLAPLSTHRRSVPVLSHAAFDKPQAADTFAETQSISTFFYKEKRSSRRSRYYSNLAKDHDSLSSSIPTVLSKAPTSHQSAAGKVVVVDLTSILPISKTLACQYMVPEKHNFVSACLHNKEKSMKEDMTDLGLLWSCVAYLPNPNVSETNNHLSPLFQSSPLGRPFLSHLMQHYSKLKDVQTLAMLACTFDGHGKIAEKTTVSRRTSRNPNVKRSMSQQNFDFLNTAPYGLHKSSSESKFPEHVDQPPSFMSAIFSNVMGRSPPTESQIVKHFKSPPESPSEEFKAIEPEIFHSPARTERPQEYRMLEDENESQCDAFKSSYSGFLQRWKVNTKIVEIQKHIRSTTSPPSVVYNASCRACGDTGSCSCAKSQFPSFIRCAICQQPVKSLLSFCGNCFHGGHLEHIQAWFAKHNRCPSSINCLCECVLG